MSRARFTPNIPMRTPCLSLIAHPQGRSEEKHFHYLSVSSYRQHRQKQPSHVVPILLRLSKGLQGIYQVVTLNGPFSPILHLRPPGSAESMSSTKVASECQNRRALFHNGDPKYCNACRRVYCDTCYDAQLVHEDEENRLNEHEKTDLDTANFVLSLFGTRGSTEDRERLHLNNIQSKWFGTDIDEQESKSYFHDFGGFVGLLQKSRLLPHQQFPSLISFVGDTGTGKSTLINGILKVYPVPT